MTDQIRSARSNHPLLIGFEKATIASILRDNNLEGFHPHLMTETSIVRWTEQVNDLADQIIEKNGSMIALKEIMARMSARKGDVILQIDARIVK